MNAVNVELDKVVSAMPVDNYGYIGIRVIVLNKLTDTASQVVTEEDADQDDMDPVDDRDTKNPVDSYLEAPGTRGRLCCVFLINGQRQHAWDNTFITRDLEFKYLRNRMLIIVDVDGMRPESIADLMQGSRHQFYEGEVYAAIQKRLIAVLKADPQLTSLEEEAEQDVLSLKTGDEVVRQALDQLIDAHHDSGDRTAHGDLQAGKDTRNEYLAGGLKQTMHTVVEGDSDIGPEATPPVLAMQPDTQAVRLHPGEDKTVRFVTRPSSFMPQLERFVVTTIPVLPDLHITPKATADGISVDLVFNETEAVDDDSYPLVAVLKGVATFKGMEDSRTCERRLVITRPKQRSSNPSQPKPLKDVPTYIRVTSHTPVRMTVAGPDVHVRLKWDGKDDLVVGDKAAWKFRATLVGAVRDLVPSFTDPKEGRFELLLRVPKDVEAGETLKLTIEAVGPSGSTLTASCDVTVVEDVSPRRVTQISPGGAQRRPPYVLKVITRKEWDTDTCWGSSHWTGLDPGAFQAPTPNQPLVLLINDDYDLLQDSRDKMIGRKLAESTIEQRNRKYQSHIAFHMWQMYLWQQEAQATPDDQNAKIPTEEDFRMEIRRVAGTLLQLMGVMQ